MSPFKIERLIPLWSLPVAALCGAALVGVPLGAFAAFQKGKVDGLIATLEDTTDKLETCQETKGGLTAANTGYKAAVDEQNAALSSFKVDLDKIGADARAARLSADKAAQVSQRAADRILSAKPQSADLCREAAALFKRTMEENRP